MTWKPLRERLYKLPLILSGPILRRTEPDAVTVWVALKESRTVTLKILDTHKKLLFQGSRKTTQLGTHLYVVTVTAWAQSNQLSHGENYLYDLDFGKGETLSLPGILNWEGSIQDIAYHPYDLPSFALVPNQIANVRIIHGSCRKSHGESLDALATVDKMIQEALVQNPTKRPHQLFLTGDQIYVDDVADALLFMLMDANQTLLGWTETLPDVENPEDLKPGKRNHLATKIAGFTASITKINKISTLAKSHLFAFGEFCTMYLFAWCDVLWPLPEDLPTFAHVHSPAPRFCRGIKAAFHKELNYLKLFQSTLKDVRRALANIPTYMIFDDHEITDDWFLNMAWCDRVLSQPLGRRVLQNGLLAYAIFQAWGNTPDQFVDEQPGKALLDAVEIWAASVGTDVQSSQEIALRVGLPNLSQMKKSNPKRVAHTTASLQWHYSITCPSYEVIVLDTRTWREFPGTDIDFPRLLSAEGCEQQISHVVRSQASKLTLVISPGPVIGLPFLENLQKTVKSFAQKFGAAVWGFDPEAWGLEDMAFERLLAKLALRANRVVILSGDVHYSFAARLQYAAKRPFQMTQLDSDTTELIVVQFTSSALKNEARGIGGSYSLHNKGFVPFKSINQLPKAEVLGWENPGGKELEIGNYYTFIDQTVQNLPWRLKGHPAKVNLIPQRDFLRTIQITRTPEWWYRIDFLPAQEEKLPRQIPRSIPSQPIPAPLPGQDRHHSLKQYLAMARNYLDYVGTNSKGKEIVGLNNIGEITFDLTEDEPKAMQTLWWRLESWEHDKRLEPFPLTRFEVSLQFNHPNYPITEVLREVQQ